MLRQLACTKDLGATSIQVNYLRTRLNNVHVTCQHTFLQGCECSYKDKCPLSSQTHSFLQLNAFVSRLEFLFISLLNETSEHGYMGLESADKDKHQDKSYSLRFTQAYEMCIRRRVAQGSLKDLLTL